MSRHDHFLIFAFLSALFLTSTVYGKDASQWRPFKLLGVEVDVVSDAYSPGYLGRREAASLVEKEIRTQLEELNLLAKPGEKSRPLYIRVDLKRKFGSGVVGKRALPLYESLVSFDLRTAAKGEGREYDSPKGWLSRRSQIDAKRLENGADVAEDLLRLYEAAGLVSKHIALLEERRKPEELVVHTMMVVVRQGGNVERQVERLAKESVKPQKSIVPPAVVQDYLQQLKQKKGKQRIALYKDIVANTWFVSERFFDQLKIRLDFQVSKKQGKPDEVAWGIKALAASGNPKYYDAIVGYAKSGDRRKIVRHAKKAQKLLAARKSLQAVAQIDAPDTRRMDWRVRQQLNLLRSGVPEYQHMAAKAIVRSYVGNRKVTDALASELVWSAERSNMRSWDASRPWKNRATQDFQILASQILAQTKIVSYRPILLRLVKNSPIKNVRKAAKASAKRLK